MNTQSFTGFSREVRYDRRRWSILMEKRRRALKVLTDLRKCGVLHAFAHGSIARGDVDEDSDVDIVMFDSKSNSIVAYCLEKNGYSIYSVSIVQATPRHTPKIYVYLDALEELCVSIPLVQLSPMEVEYYRFSGMVGLEDIVANARVMGVDKRLMLIAPTEFGHTEFPVIGNEGYIARVLGISLASVMDRVEALSRRVEEGHTGLFIKIELPEFEQLESAIDKLCVENSLFRRRVEEYGLCT
ncbi:MAG: nucleotidyltransferase domain-containing protein [Ignisphaera sp.]|nr:nucleotidyltransferase domain-containing protein [Ignisphaera sp.]